MASIHHGPLAIRPTGADTVNPQLGAVVAENDTMFDECAGSLQLESGAYGYRVMPPCLYNGPSSVPKVIAKPATRRLLLTPCEAEHLYQIAVC